MVADRPPHQREGLEVDLSRKVTCDHVGLFILGRRRAETDLASAFARMKSSGFKLWTLGVLRSNFERL